MPADAVILRVIDDLIERNQRLEAVWKNSHGWALANSAKLLEESRLDRQVSLCRTLKIWCEACPEDEAEARLILAWANLRGLVEGTLKFFLTIYLHDYGNNHKDVHPTRKHSEPDGLYLESLKQYFTQIVWMPEQRQRLEPFLNLVQARGNAIHPYQHRDMGTFDEFYDAITMYSELLAMVEGQMPPEPEREIWQ